MYVLPICIMDKVLELVLNLCNGLGVIRDPFDHVVKGTICRSHKCVEWPGFGVLNVYRMLQVVVDFLHISVHVAN